ncbi:MAG: DUF1501 domain-containing protein [Burkholderiales bacterium]|nr:DUF1501 domain-containing protein [Burkholderiales bacterium]
MSSRDHSVSRRLILKTLGASALLSALPAREAAAQASDYKALVCVFLQGGNDGENTLIRHDTAGYASYAAVRTPASGINVPRAQLLAIEPRSVGAPFGFHPSCDGLRDLFDRGRLAVVANMGILTQPSTRTGLEAGGTPRPANLFSHPDQELATESGDPKGYTRTGWGGRLADRLDAANGGQLFPALTSAAGMRTFTSGNSSIPLAITRNPYFSLFGTGRPFQFDALREAAAREILAQSSGNVYQLVGQILSREGMASSSVVQPLLVNPASIVPPFFAGAQGDVGQQLRNVAAIIEGRAQTGLRRQVFFVSQTGYDTHAEQLPYHDRFLSDLSAGIKAFDDCVEALGLAASVTTFTLSEFGRTFKPASNQGTDHGWGNYAFVTGGAVKGGDFYGTIPTLALNGPDDLGKEGRWIPTTSLEQYGATLCRWFGIAEGDLPYIFPNIGAFANTNLGFMA